MLAFIISLMGRKAINIKRCTHKPEFKSKIAPTAIQGELTMAEMVKKYDIHANQITEWKKKLLSGAQDVFGSRVNLSEEFELNRTGFAGDWIS